MLAIKEREAARDHCVCDLRSIDRAGKAATVDLPTVERELRAKLDEWKVLLRKHVPQARQVLKKLLAGPLVFTRTPNGRGPLLRVPGPDRNRPDCQWISGCKYGGVPNGS